MWIESHQSLLRHRKTNAAVRLLGCDRFKLIGHLHALWWWALDNAPSGQVLSAYDVTEGAEWSGDPEHFAQALTTAGFLDPVPDGYQIHEWDQFIGRIEDGAERYRAANRERQRRWRERHRPPPPTPHNVTNNVSNGPTIQDNTKQDQDPPTVDRAANVTPPATTDELRTLHVLKNVRGYPFEYSADLEHIRELAVDFPNVDISSTLKDWAAAKTTDPLKANQKPRAQHRNWCRKRLEWSSNGRSHAATGRATRDNVADRDHRKASWSRESH